MKHYIGIDIGGTYTRAVMLSGLTRQKTVLTKIRTARNHRDAERNINELISRISDGKKLAGIGVSIAGTVDRTRGVFVSNDNLPFRRGWKIKKALAAFRVPVLVDNDADCFMRAEWKWGAGKRFRNFIGVVIGTGIGGSIVLNGEIFNGAHGLAGEFGYMIMDEKRRKIFDEIGAKRAFLRYGDRSRVIGMGVASVSNIFDPEAVILGGGGVFSEHFSLSRVRNAARRYMIMPQIPIMKGALGDTAQAIGAALLFK